MADPIKFTEEELQSITDLQTSYNQITMAMGQITISRMNLDERVKPYSSEKTNNIIVEFTTEVFNQEEMQQIFYYFQNISSIIRNSGEIGQFELGRLKITINSLETFEKNLIKCFPV